MDGLFCCFQIAEQIQKLKEAKFVSVIIYNTMRYTVGYCSNVPVVKDTIIKEIKIYPILIRLMSISVMWYRHHHLFMYLLG